MPKRQDYFVASQLKPDELPTIRDVICFAKYLQDNFKGKCIGVGSPDIGKKINNFVFVKFHDLTGPGPDQF